MPLQSDSNSSGRSAASNPLKQNPTGAGPERFLRVDHLSGDLRGRSVRGGAVTLTNQAVKFLMMLGSTAILARLLTPADFGLIGMVIAVIGFIATFKDMGLAMATVQRAEINHGQVSTLFWINLGLSVLIMAAMAAIAPLLAWFYKEPQVARITVALAMTVLFSGLAVQHQALLRRQMRFGALALIEVVAIFLGFASAVAAALLGAGYWALVLVHVVREMSMAVGVWAMCGWRPGRPVRRSGVRTMISFGAHLTGFNIVNYFARNLDKILVGRYLGAATLGLYEKAYQLVLLPIRQIDLPMTSVAVPTLSRLQNQLERYRAYYRRGVMLTVAASMPVVAFLFVAADKAVLTLLGAQWTYTVVIFRVLAGAAFFGTLNVAVGWVYVSLGMTKRQFKWGVFASLVTSAAFVIGLRWGAIGVAAAFSISAAVQSLPAIAYCLHPSPLRLRDVGVAVWRSAAASIAAAVLLYLTGRLFAVDWPLFFSLLLDFVIYAVFYASVWVALPRGRRSMREVFDIVRELKPTPYEGGGDQI